MNLPNIPNNTDDKISSQTLSEIDGINEFCKSFNRYVASCVEGTFSVDLEGSKIVTTNMSKYTPGERYTDGPYINSLTLNLSRQKAEVLVGVFSYE